MIDRELVDRKIVLIAPDLAEVQAIVARGRKAFLANRMEQVVVERYLERIIGRMIDVNYHLLTETGHPPPKDYYQSFIELGGRALPQEFAARIASAAGLRNRIAHEYDDLDPARLFEGMETAARDIPVWVKHVVAYLESRAG
jgi:uncharacterized protein YutE (UPF0331/DUF86 family)